MFNKFSIFILKFLISLVLITFIFSAAPFAIDDMIAKTFGNIFDYASPDTQNKTIEKFASACDSTDENGKIITAVQLCNDESLRSEVEEYCINYRDLLSKNRIETNEEVEKTCKAMEEGTIDEICDKLDGQISDTRGVPEICEDFKNGKINDRDFFVSFIGNTFGNVDIPKITLFEKFGKVILYFETYNILYVVILGFLFGFLFLLIKDVSLFFVILSGILFSISLFLLLPYIAIFAYDHFVGIETDILLESLFGQGGFDAKSILSVLLLAILSVYNKTLLTIVVIFLIFGVSGRIYGLIVHRKTEPEKIKGIKPKSKRSKQTKINAKTKGPKDNITNSKKNQLDETLDVLDEVGKKVVSKIEKQKKIDALKKKVKAQQIKKTKN